MALRELALPRASTEGAERSAVVVAASLVRRFGEVEAVRGVSFTVGEGEIFGFLGPNGERHFPQLGRRRRSEPHKLRHRVIAAATVAL